MAITERDVLQKIEDGDTAYGLLVASVPGVERRWNRLCKSMNVLLAEVRKDFPDACYYTEGGGFALLLGSSHNSANLRSQQQLRALVGRNVEVGDGDY